MEKTPHFSPNFSSKSRLKSKIKFVIIHYTGMQSEIGSIRRLKNPNSRVSCHYLINRKGKIFQMVNDNKTAWHAGKSKWKSFKNLNHSSIGIELVNKGKKFGYETFPKSQIKNLISLCKFLKRKYRIKRENFLGHSDIAPLRKNDPGEKFPWKKLSKIGIGKWYSNLEELNDLKKRKYRNFFFHNLHKIGYRYFNIKVRQKLDKKIISAFQLRYLPNKVTGKLDKKTLKISHFLANN